MNPGRTPADPPPHDHSVPMSERSVTSTRIGPSATSFEIASPRITTVFPVIHRRQDAGLSTHVPEQELFSAGRPWCDVHALEVMSTHETAMESSTSRA
jgi:hypothetical protein